MKGLRTVPTFEFHCGGCDAFLDIDNQSYVVPDGKGKERAIFAIDQKSASKIARRMYGWRVVSDEWRCESCSRAARKRDE